MNRLSIYGFLTIALLSSFLSCNNKTPYPEELIEAEKFMHDKPDSALTLLKKITNPQDLPTDQKALHNLLLTQAMDKRYIRHTSDSIISIAAQYFEKQNDPHRKAMAWYYMGRVAEDLSQTEKALDYYIKAIPYTEEVKDYKLLSLIYNGLGNLYRKLTLYDKALVAANKAAQISEMAKDSLNLVYAIRNIGRIHLLLDDLDSIIYYYDKALALADIIKNPIAKSAVLNDKGSAYIEFGKYSEALETMKEAISYRPEKNNYPAYFNLGRVYNQINELDSAKYYLNLATKSSNIYTQSASHFRLYKIFKEKRNYAKALESLEISDSLRDSITHIHQKDEILKITYEYQNKEAVKEIELRSVKERLIFLTVTIVLLSFIGLGFITYYKNRLYHEHELRLKERKIEFEREQRLHSEEQIMLNKKQIEVNQHELATKEQALLSVQQELVNYSTKFLKMENDLINLKREELLFRNKLFEQTGLSDRIKITGANPLKTDYKHKPFSLKEMPLLIKALDNCYDNFADRLSKKFPNLKPRDIEICYLIKAGAKTSNLAQIIPMTPNAVTKKKKLILEKMEIIDKNMTLEKFLDTF